MEEIDHQYEYLKRQHYLATHMELTEENVVRVLEELLPYIEADGGSLQLVLIFLPCVLPIRTVLQGIHVDDLSLPYTQ